MTKLFVDTKNQTIGINDPDPSNQNRIELSVLDAIPFKTFLAIVQAAQSTKDLGQLYIFTFGK